MSKKDTLILIHKTLGECSTCIKLIYFWIIKSIRVKTIVLKSMQSSLKLNRNILFSKYQWNVCIHRKDSRKLYKIISKSSHIYNLKVIFYWVSVFFNVWLKFYFSLIFFLQFMMSASFYLEKILWKTDG